MANFCKVKMSDRLQPVAGTADGPVGARTGTCPACNTPGVRLAISGGHVRAHVISDHAVPENGHASAVTVQMVDVRSKAKCTFNGEPLSVKHKVMPIAGTVREAVAGEFKGSAIQNPDKAGECPECRAFVPLSSKGFVTAHIVHNEPTPASKELTDTSVPPTDTGARVGDPGDGFQRRMVDVDGAYERGTVQAPVKGENGRTKLEDVPGTAENVRKALDYWLSRAPRKEASKAQQSKMVAELTRRLRAFEGASAPRYDAESAQYVPTASQGGVKALKAQVSPEGFTQQALPGAPMVKGRNMAPVQPMRRNAKTGELEVSSIGTMGGNLGRERIDRTLLDPRDPGHFTPSQRNNYRKKMRRLAAKTARQSSKD